MAADNPEIDWAEIARLPVIVAEAGDLDVVELVQRRLVVPRLRLTHAAMAMLNDIGTVVVRDVEATPLLLGRFGSGLLEVSPLRAVVPADTDPAETDTVAGEADSAADLAVVVRGGPSTADLIRVDALLAPHTSVVWLVLCGRTRAGRRLLGEVPDVVARRPRGHHRIVRVPWPTPGSRGVFERPRLPSAAVLAEAYAARHFVVVGEVPGSDLPRRDRGGTVVFFTGLSGSGKSTVARALRDAVEHRSDREVTLLDGDDVRRMLSAGLGFDTAGREANVRRVSWVAAMLARHGGIAITALIAPFAEGRAEARRMARDGADFVLVWVSTPLDECERRDRKGLYARARAGELPEFTGIDSPYEVPDDADLVIDTTRLGVHEVVATVVAELEARALRRGEDFLVAEAEDGPEQTEHELMAYEI